MMKLHPWIRTLLSLVLYVSVYYLLFKDLRSIGLLVLVIVLHELGHYIAMKAYGYSNVQMLFVPMLGAFVSGKPSHVDPGKKLVVLFSGPLPGIVLGVICAMVYSRTQQQIFYQLALMFILLNIFNLIPLSPMDGGQIMETLFSRSSRWIQTVFIVIAVLITGYFFLVNRNLVLIIVLLLLVSRMLNLWTRKVDDSENKTELHRELSWKDKVMFLALWTAAIVIPLQTLYRIF